MGDSTSLKSVPKMLLAQTLILLAAAAATNGAPWESWGSSGGGSELQDNHRGQVQRYYEGAVVSIEVHRTLHLCCKFSTPKRGNQKGRRPVAQPGCLELVVASRPVGSIDTAIFAAQM